MKKSAKNKTQSFVTGVKREWANIKWPSKKTLKKQTVTVIVVSIIIVGIIILTDAGAIKIISNLF